MRHRWEKIKPCNEANLSFAEVSAVRGGRPPPYNKEVAMTKIDMINLISAKARIKKAAAERAIETFVQAIKDTLSKEREFTITGLGTFYISRRAARRGRNPKTGEEIQIPPIETVRFRASAKMKRRLK
jgi:DNA-binding protein HU-beta